MRRAYCVFIWIALLMAIITPIVIAANSPLLAWRSPVYIAASFAGITAMTLILVQPVLIGGNLPGLSAHGNRKLHRLVGVGLIISILAHVGGLWISNAPDVIDALLFASPTPFSVWGVIGMWAIFGAAFIGLYRNHIRKKNWRNAHLVLAGITAVTTVIHALLIEGTMGYFSKIALCVLVIFAVILLFARKYKQHWMRQQG